MLNDTQYPTIFFFIQQMGFFKGLAAWLVRVASEGAGGRAREPFVEHCFPPCVKQKYRESRPLGSKNKRALCSHKQHCTSTYDISKKNQFGNSVEFSDFLCALIK
uniref:Uncharacterized protein n=1 Tax=Cacopsylla melanoneura TaxID=428564 RepID=A0A8D8Z8U1_9HEMI